MATAFDLAKVYASLKDKIRQLSETIFFYGDGLCGAEEYPISHYEEQLSLVKSMLAELESKLKSINVS